MILVRSSSLGLTAVLVFCCVQISLAQVSNSTNSKPENNAVQDFESLPLESLPLFAEYSERFEVKNDHASVGLPSIIVDADADLELAAKRVVLGRRLFFDPILSKDNTIACVSCHRPELAFALNKPKSVGLSRRESRRNVPSILNRGFANSQFWDGRAESLEEQALIPIENEEELGHSLEEVLKSLEAHGEYKQLFRDAFVDGITKENLASAIASFERTLISGNSVIDRFQNSLSSLNDRQRHGLWLYESKAGCWKCHSNSIYSDEQFHNTGVSWGVEPLDLGLYEITEYEPDKGKFKTPSLRDVALTGPYMHDGSIGSLREVVEFYSKGGNKNPLLDEKLKPLELSEREIESLVVFLESLTGDHPWHNSQTQPTETDQANDQEDASKTDNSKVNPSENNDKVK